MKLISCPSVTQCLFWIKEMHQNGLISCQFQVMIYTNYNEMCWKYSFQFKKYSHIFYNSCQQCAYNRCKRMFWIFQIKIIFINFKQLIRTVIQEFLTQMFNIFYVDIAQIKFCDLINKSPTNHYSYCIFQFLTLSMSLIWVLIESTFPFRYL